MAFIPLMWEDLKELSDKGQCAVMLADAILTNDAELPELFISMFLMALIDIRKPAEGTEPVDPYEYVRMLRDMATECLHVNGQE